MWESDLLDLNKHICLIKKYLKADVAKIVEVGKMRNIPCGQVQMKVTLEEVRYSRATKWSHFTMTFFQKVHLAISDWNILLISSQKGIFAADVFDMTSKNRKII